MPELHANIFTLGEHNFLKPYWGVVKDIDMKIYDFQCNKIGYNPYGDKRAVPGFRSQGRNDLYCFVLWIATFNINNDPNIFFENS